MPLPKDIRSRFTSPLGRYALALYQACKDSKDDFKKVSDTLSTFTDLLKTKKYRTFFLAQNISLFDKEKALKEISEKTDLPKVLLPFFKILLENHRFLNLKTIAKDFQAIVNILSKQESVTVYSKKTLSADQKKKLKDYLTDKLDKKISLSYQKDQKLLGGFYVQSDQMVIDATINTQIRQLASHLREV